MSLANKIDSLSNEDKKKLSYDLERWYNVLIKLYKQDFQIGDDNYIREYTDSQQVIRFFRESLLWWHRKKPSLGCNISPLDILKTRVCLGQITSLQKRFNETQIPLDELHIDSWETKVSRETRETKVSMETRESKVSNNTLHSATSNKLETIKE